MRHAYHVVMDLEHLRSLHSSATRMLGNWWQDDRRNWCAYCGIPMRKKAGKGMPLPPNKATRDHVIPKVHSGGGVTIPACRQCNEAKAGKSLQEFLQSAHFKDVRARRHRNKWPLHRLWSVAALAALKNAETALPKSTVSAGDTAKVTKGHTR